MGGAKKANSAEVYYTSIHIIGAFSMCRDFETCISHPLHQKLYIPGPLHYLIGVKRLDATNNNTVA